MLNLNYNIIGSIGPRVDRQGAIYQIRLDPYSSSLVVAMPGNLFRDGDYTNQFGMTNAWDDISAYIKGGPNGAPVGNNVEIILSASLNPTSSSISLNNNIIKWQNERYNESIYMSGINSLVANKVWNKNEGANFSFSSSFVIESWVAYPDTGSATISSYKPDRIFAWKYDPGFVSSSQYVWQAWGGDIDPGGGVLLVSGSTRFAYTLVSGSGPIPYEAYAYPQSSSLITPYQWNHLAVVYTSGSEVIGGGLPVNRQLKLYINGNLNSRVTIAANEEFMQDTAELLQIMGAVDASYSAGGYSGSAVLWQDFRMYNGTDKNYTGSIIQLPQSMVTYG